MSLQVVELRDPGAALERARTFLTSRPIEHSVELSLGGTFWLVEDGAEVVGFALKSPPGRGAVLAPMPASTARRLAESIDAPLRHVVGEAGTTAAFAGRWTECRSTSVTEIEGQRLYELTELRSVARSGGVLRPAGAGDRSTLVEWARAFVEELALFPEDTEAVVDRRLGREQFWVWDDNGIASMASASAPTAGVTRVQHVYTPPDRRGSGYATACVEHMSRVLTERGLRCVLYTDLANPTSNAIYRRIGYEVAAEVLGYDFA